LGSGLSWMPVRERADEPLELNPTDLAKITGTLLISDIGFIEAKVYNGTKHRLSSISVDITIKGAARETVLARRYRLITNLGALSAGECAADSGFVLGPGQT
jgi:hypothetical protein